MTHKILVGAACLAIFVFSCRTEDGGVAPALPLPEAPLEGISEALLMGDPEKAIASYERAFTNAPQDASTRILHARLLLLARRVDEAKREIASVLATDPDHADALYARSLAAAMEGDAILQKSLLEKIVSGKEPPADAFASLGALSLHDKEYGKAREYFTKARVLDERNLAAAVGLGKLNFKEQKFAEAKKYFDEAVSIAPHYPFAYSDRALVKRRLGDAAGALADLDHAIRLEPDYSYNYFDRGRIYLDQGKWNEALADFNTAIEKEPDMFAAFVFRAGLYDGMEKLDEALSDYDKVLTLRPDYYFAYPLAGAIEFMKERPEKAFARFSSAFLYQRNVPEYALLAALSLKKAGRTKEAADYLLKNADAFPRDGWQYAVLRWYLDPTSGDNLITVMADREKNKSVRAQIVFHLGEQYLFLGKKSLARTCFQQASAVERKGLIEKRLARYELGCLNKQ